MAPDPYLSVVVPAYNEESRLPGSLDAIVEYLRSRKRRHEVIVVDDGSTDSTAAIVRGFHRRSVSLVQHPRRLGKGAAIKTGILATTGKWVLLTDADLSAPMANLARLEAYCDSAGAIVGSRAVGGAEISPRQPIYRELLGKSFNLLLRYLGVTGLRDTQCGFKLIRGDVARRAVQSVEIGGFAFDAELLWFCRRSGAEIREVGVRWGHSAPSSVHILRDSAQMLSDILRFRSRLRSVRGFDERRGSPTCEDRSDLPADVED